ncbi:MAG: cell division transport system permease protein [Thermovirga sp.]|nr:cell division transport system permease protein [Thermovirga sp.]
MTTFKYILRDAFRLMTRNVTLSFLTLVTTVAVFFLISCSILFVMNIRNIVAGIENNLMITAYVTKDKSSAQAVAEKIGNLECVDSVKIVTPDKALEELRARLGNQADVVTLLDDNPLPPSVEIRLKDAGAVPVVARELLSMEEVEDIVYAGELARRLETLSAFVSRFSFGVLVIALAVGALVVFNTIRIGVYARREEIEIMLLIGATPGFVAFPFVLHGSLISSFGALLAGAGVYFSYERVVSALMASMPFLNFMTDQSVVMDLWFLLVGGGLTVGWICSWLAVSKFVRRAMKPR